MSFILARLLGRKCVVIASGYDVASMPEIDYGNLRPGLRRYIGLSVFRLAHRIIAVSQFTAQEVIYNARISPAKVQVIYHGLEVPAISKGQVSLGERCGILTVGIVKQSNLFRKGLVAFVKAASHLQNIPAKLVGPWVDSSINILKSITVSEVEFVGPNFGDALLKQMLSASVYVQLSKYESFGMSVAEAMLCGCIPVVSDCGALPEVVGDTGFIVPYGDEQATVKAIRQALVAGSESRDCCRRHIIDTFPLKKREEQLLQAIREVSGQP